METHLIHTEVQRLREYLLSQGWSHVESGIFAKQYDSPDGTWSVLTRVILTMSMKVWLTSGAIPSTPGGQPSQSSQTNGGMGLDAPLRVKPKSMEDATRG